MGIFKLIYSWFYSIYSMYLFDYLKGMDCNGHDVGPDHFITIGSYMIIASLLVAIMYYYVINHPRFNRLWSWLIMLFSSAIINFIAGFAYTYNRLHGGQIPECFTEPANMSIANCISFGLTNAFIGIFFFFIISMLLKLLNMKVLKSLGGNTKHSPF